MDAELVADMIELDDSTILPHEGFGSLKFGLTPFEVKKRMGEAAEIDRSGVKGWLTWKYPEKGLEISFVQNETYRLLSLTTGHPLATLSGVRVIGCAESEILRLARRLSLGKPIREEFGEGLGFQICFSESDIEFVFSRVDADVGSTASFVSWRVRIDELDKVHWPQ